MAMEGGGGGGIHLKREDYYTSPPFHQLKNYTQCGIYTVEKLTIGRNGFGSITFYGPVNIKDLNFDDIVLINHKEVIVYPQEEQKPPTGHGLNCAAEVRLERVWPTDVCTSKYITDPHTLEEICFEKRLKEANERHSATFLKYIPETGSWIFKVDHFSKYGLYDTDEEADDKEENKKNKVKRHSKAKQFENIGTPKENIVDEYHESPNNVLPLSNAIQSGQTSTPINGFIEEKLQFIGRNFEDDDVVMKEDYQTSIDIVSHIRDAWIKPFRPRRSLDVSQEKILSMRGALFTEFDEDSPEEALSSISSPGHLSLHGSMTTDQGSSAKKPPKDFQKYDHHLEDEYPANKIRRITKMSMPVEQISGRKGQLKCTPPLQSITGIMKTAKVGPLVKFQGKGTLEASVFKYPSHVVPLQKSSTHNIQFRSTDDLNIYKGCGFRVGWGPGGELLILTTQKLASSVTLEAGILDLDKYLKGRSADDNSKQIVQRICLRGGRELTTGGGVGGRVSFENELKCYWGQHLNVTLKHSEFYEDENVPGLRPILGSEAVAFHDCCNLKDKCEEREYSRNVWHLCNALWGDLPEYVSPVNSHHNLMLRKEYLGNWLTTIFRKELMTKHDGKLYAPKSGEDCYLEEIWNLLTANLIKDACNVARENGDVFLVTLLTQVASSQFVSYLIKEQITTWIDINGEQLIKKDRLKLFLLLCCTPLYTTKEETVNVCERLDWKRTLGMHLWFLTSDVQTIKDAFVMYQNAFHPKEFRDLYAKAPLPPYTEEGYLYDPEEKLPPLDLCYHLLHLYCDRFYSMTKMLDPVTHTVDVLDYSLSWLVYTSLHAIGYHHTSEYGAAQVHASFAAQLESYGMWHWAIFVLLHIPDKTRRQTAVIRLLERKVGCHDDIEYKKKECFVTNVLKIPASWIYEIKAHWSFSQEKYHFTVCFLNKAENFNLAHKILMKHLAPGYVLNERYTALVTLLEPLANECKKNSTVFNWDKGGYIIWLYLKVMTRINYMLQNPECVDGYHLESIQVDAINLCKLLPELMVSNVMDRLYRIDICERLFDLVGEFVKLQRDDQMSCRILLYMTTKLPMPDNFKVIERRNFINNWPEDFANCRLFT